MIGPRNTRKVMSKTSPAKRKARRHGLSEMVCSFNYEPRFVARPEDCRLMDWFINDKVSCQAKCSLLEYAVEEGDTCEMWTFRRVNIRLQMNGMKSLMDHSRDPIWGRLEWQPAPKCREAAAVFPEAHRFVPRDWIVAWVRIS